MAGRIPSPGAVAAVAVAAAITAAGCTQSVDGAARRAKAGVGDPDRSYGYVDDRCGLLVDGSIKEALAADDIVRPYSGAVCQYVLSKRQQLTDVTFFWFEVGTLDREKALSAERGAQITETVVERHTAILARRDGTGPACAATAAAGTGVLSWWVQFRGQGLLPVERADPCDAAEQLLARTLSSDL